jgi:hypothetical protein
MLKLLLSILTDFGPAAAGIILFTVGYFEWRMNRVTKKLTETDFTISDLEKENLKNVNDVRADSYRDSRNILLLSEMQGKTSTQAFLLLVTSVNKNAEAIVLTADTIKHFSENLERLENAILASARNEGERRIALTVEVQSLKEDLESLQSTVGLHESIMQVREEPLIAPPSEVSLVELLPSLVQPDFEQRLRNTVPSLFSLDIEEDIDAMNKTDYEHLLVQIALFAEKNGHTIPTAREALDISGLTGLEADVYRFRNTGTTARFDERFL